MSHRCDSHSLCHKQCLRLSVAASTFINVLIAAGGSDALAVIAKEQAFVRARADTSVVFDVPTETDYVPNVVQAENGAASFEALKAQAVAARTFLYHRLNVSGAIFDGTEDQVYSDGLAPLAIHQNAASTTEREILRFASSGNPLDRTDLTVAAFFVAGARPDPATGTAPFGEAEVPPDSDPTGTERFVTYNKGRFGNNIDPTPLGFVPQPPLEPIDNPFNRGAMSQNGSDFLSDKGWNYVDVLRFYYGADIRLEMAETPASGRLAAPKTLADFELDAGYFGNDPAATSGHRNLRIGNDATRWELTQSDSVSGDTAQRIVLTPDDSTTEGFEMRHSAGMNEVREFLGTPTSNLAVEPIGSFSVWLKTGDTGLSTALAINDADVDTALGTTFDIIADGEWHQYEWFLGDLSRWQNQRDSGFDFESLVSLESIRLFGRTDAEVLMDDLVYTPSARVPEPGGIKLIVLALGAVSLVIRPRKERVLPAPGTLRHELA